jgi:hypothetical protein
MGGGCGEGRLAFTSLSQARAPKGPVAKGIGGGLWEFGVGSFSPPAWGFPDWFAALLAGMDRVREGVWLLNLPQVWARAQA